MTDKRPHFEANPCQPLFWPEHCHTGLGSPPHSLQRILLRLLPEWMQLPGAVERRRQIGENLRRILSLALGIAALTTLFTGGAYLFLLQLSSYGW